MKNHFSKAFTAIVAGVLIFALASTVFAAAAQVNPNFTSLKVGSVPDPVSGEIRSIKTTSRLVNTLGLITNQIVPTATTVEVVGDLDVDGDLDTAGTVYGEAFGDFYIRDDVCGIGTANGSCDTYDTGKYEWTVSCAAGDIAVNCATKNQVDLYLGEQVDMDAYSSVTEDFQGCYFTSRYNFMEMQALCFNPNGSDPDAILMEVIF